MRKLTPTIARALAEKVRAELVARNATNREALTKKIETSKIYKELCKVVSQQKEIEEKKRELVNQINETFSNKVSDVSISMYSSDRIPNISIRETAKASIENIKDMILIEDYLSNGGETTEEIIARIADQLCS